MSEPGTYMVSKKFDGLQGLLLYLHQNNECYLVDHTMALYELRFNLQPMADPPKDMLLDGELITNKNTGWFVVSDVLYCEDGSTMAKPFTQRMAFAKTHFVKEEEMWNGVPRSSVRLVAKTLSPMKDLNKVWRSECPLHSRRTGMRFLGRGGGGLKGGAKMREERRVLAARNINEMDHCFIFGIRQFGDGRREEVTW